jgi:outer membrane lipoprotein
MDTTSTHPIHTPPPRLALILVLLLSALAGCATSPFSKQIREAAKRQPSFTDISTRPEAYKGRPMLLGGTIIQTTNRPQGSEIEVLQRPLDSWDERPEDTDQSYGRFLIRCPQFLDSAVYAKDRDITVAGNVLGTETRPLDQTQYPYPIIGCTQIQLWPIRPPVAYYGYPGPYGYGPWWGYPGYYPYWYPYW